MSLLSFVFFFFKQKTAYEMRISDWSSDVCSSDLCGRRAGYLSGDLPAPDYGGAGATGAAAVFRTAAGRAADRQRARTAPRIGQCRCRPRRYRGAGTLAGDRSEEHTSELQSLMRISYAVLCLKKTKTNKTARHAIMRDQQSTCTRS